MYEITKNLLAGEALRVFEHQAKDKGSNTTIECKPFIEGMVTHFSPPQGATITEKFYTTRPV